MCFIKRFVKKIIIKSNSFYQKIDNESCDNKKEYIIGSFKTGGRRIDHDANALLISKAPELLSKLKEVLFIIDWSYEAWTSNDGINMKEEIEKLLKEAIEL